MAATNKAAPQAKSAKKAPRKKKQATSSAPGEAAEAHKWLQETQLQASDIEGPTEVTIQKPIEEKPKGLPHRFQPGNKLGGRPKGSRNKFAEEFISDFLEDWKAHGIEAIAEVRQNKPEAYLKVAATILPKTVDVRVSEFEELTNDALDKKIAELARQMGAALAILQPNEPRH